MTALSPSCIHNTLQFGDDGRHAIRYSTPQGQTVDQNIVRWQVCATHGRTQPSLGISQSPHDAYFHLQPRPDHLHRYSPIEAVLQGYSLLSSQGTVRETNTSGQGDISTVRYTSDHPVRLTAGTLAAGLSCQQLPVSTSSVPDQTQHRSYSYSSSLPYHSALPSKYQRCNTYGSSVSDPETGTPVQASVSNQQQRSLKTVKQNISALQTS